MKQSETTIDLLIDVLTLLHSEGYGSSLYTIQIEQIADGCIGIGLKVAELAGGLDRVGSL